MRIKTLTRKHRVMRILSEQRYTHSGTGLRRLRPSWAVKSNLWHISRRGQRSLVGFIVLGPQKFQGIHEKNDGDDTPMDDMNLYTHPRGKAVGSNDQRRASRPKPQRFLNPIPTICLQMSVELDSWCQRSTTLLRPSCIEKRVTSDDA